MARRRRRIVRSTRLILIGLFFLSVAGLLLPGSWTHGLISLVQVAIPFVDGAQSVSESVLGGGRGNASPVPPETHLALQREKRALEHQVVALATRVRSLEDEVALLTATRLWDVDNARLGARGRLIPAKVIHLDILFWRDSRLVRAGTLQGVRRGAPVTSAQFTIDRGKEAGLRNGLAIVLGETLIGFVEQAGTHTARVKLLSDVSVQMKVRVGRLMPNGFVPREGFFWLIGRGHGLMELRDLQRDQVRQGLIAPGDIVLSDPTSSLLPVAMVIGKIVRIDPDRTNPLLSIATVAGESQPVSLQRVYVYDPQSESKPAPDPSDG